MGGSDKRLIPNMSTPALKQTRTGAKMGWEKYQDTKNVRVMSRACHLKLEREVVQAR